jgi:hypothetical protein
MGDFSSLPKYEGHPDPPVGHRDTDRERPKSMVAEYAIAIGFLLVVVFVGYCLFLGLALLSVG